MPFLWLFYAIVFLLLWAPAAWAAIACVNPTNGITDITNLQSTFTSGSITPNSGELALVAVGNRKSTAANAPALSGTNGWSVTWTQIASLNTGGSTLSKITLFRGVPSSGTAGTLSIDFSGVNQAQGIIIVILCSGVDQATNQGIVQSEIGSAASGTSHDVNLLAFGDAANGTALFGMSRGSPSAWTPDGGYTGYSTLAGTQGGGIEWLASNDTTPTAGVTGGTNWAAIAVEIKATVAGAAANFFKRRIVGY